MWLIIVWNIIDTLVNPNDKIKYSKYLNLVLNAVFYLYLSLIRNRLYILNKSKAINYQVLVNLSLNSIINDKK